ncbi:hypothetical protein MTP99_004838 [Tenebrio molitor]|nr:hypothetical protein MTP99_004838 [Tenebrio molitor]
MLHLVLQSNLLSNPSGTCVYVSPPFLFPLPHCPFCFTVSRNSFSNSLTKVFRFRDWNYTVPPRFQMKLMNYVLKKKDEECRRVTYCLPTINIERCTDVRDGNFDTDILIRTVLVRGI